MIRMSKRKLAGSKRVKHGRAKVSSFASDFNDNSNPGDPNWRQRKIKLSDVFPLSPKVNKSK